MAVIVNTGAKHTGMVILIKINSIKRLIFSIFSSILVYVAFEMGSSDSIFEIVQKAHCIIILLFIKFNQIDYIEFTCLNVRFHFFNEFFNFIDFISTYNQKSRATQYR